MVFKMIPRHWQTRLKGNSAANASWISHVRRQGNKATSMGSNPSAWFFLFLYLTPIQFLAICFIFHFFPPVFRSCLDLGCDMVTIVSVCHFTPVPAPGQVWGAVRLLGRGNQRCMQPFLQPKGQVTRLRMKERKILAVHFLSLRSPTCLNVLWSLNENSFMSGCSTATWRQEFQKLRICDLIMCCLSEIYMEICLRSPARKYINEWLTSTLGVRAVLPRKDTVSFPCASLLRHIMV